MLLDAAIEEVRHMCVLLRFGDMRLAPPDLAHRLGQGVCGPGREGDLDRQTLLVGGHRHDQQIGRGRSAGWVRPVEAVERGALGQGMGQLAGPVCAEVQVDDGVAILKGPVRPVDGGRRHELVRLAAGVRVGDGGGGRRGVMGGRPMDDGVVARLHPVPASVPIHGEIAPTDRGDPGVPVDRSETRLQVRHELQCGAWRRIPPVQKGVDPNGREPVPGGQCDERHQVPIVGMHAARPDEPDDVQGPTALHGSRTGSDQCRPVKVRAVVDRGVDPGQVLQDWASGAQVQVPHFGVTHLSRW